MLNAVLLGLLAGLVGGVHCIGMCGPLALSLPLGKNNSNATQNTYRILYHLGRALTYASLGLVIGYIGYTVKWFGIQQKLSIAFGIIFLIYFFQQLFHIQFYKPVVTQKNGIGSITLSKWNRFTQRLWMQLYNKPVSPLTPIGFGILNGLLPCGLVYMALATASTYTTPLQSGAYMFSFGFGTVPFLFTLQLFKKQLQHNYKNLFRKIALYTIAIMGVLLILRGMNLDIPFVSLKAPQTAEAINCH